MSAVTREEVVPVPVELYRRTTQKPQTRLSKQNLHIAASFEQANTVLIELLQKGMTVLSVHIEDSQPLIEIEECKAALQLPNTLRSLSIGGEMVYRRTAMLHGCCIVWISHHGDLQ